MGEDSPAPRGLQNSLAVVAAKPQHRRTKLCLWTEWLGTVLSQDVGAGKSKDRAGLTADG